MEQSDRSQQSNLSLIRQGASHVPELDTSNIAVMKNFIEFLAELKEAQEEEWRKVGYDPQVPTSYEDRWYGTNRLNIYSKPHSAYMYHRSFPEGRYAINPQRAVKRPMNNLWIWVEENCLDTILRLLTKLIEGVVKGRSTFQDALNVLSEQESHELFFNLSFYAGFYNFVPHYRDKEEKTKVSGKEYVFEQFPPDEISFCEQAFSQLWIFPSLTEEQWEMLRNIARIRARDRLRYLYYMRKYPGDRGWAELVYHEGEKVAYSFRYTDMSWYSYAKPFHIDELETCVNAVVSEEERRLRACIDRLSVPLIMLAQQRIDRKRKVVTRVTDVASMLQSLTELLQIETKALQEETSILRKETTIVESSVSQDTKEELFTVELEDIGTVIALSKKDAALVVYAPAEYKRKRVKIITAQGLEIAAYLVQQHVDGDSYAAVFPRLPLENGITETVVVVCDTLKVGDDNTVTLFSSNVTKIFLEE